MSNIAKLGKSEREKQLKQVACVIAWRGGEILMGKRRDVQKWCLPGGHLEPGESPKEGARRELFEEAGLDPEYVDELGFCDAGRNGDVRVYCFWAEVEGKPTAENDPDEEFEEFRWVKPGSLPKEVSENLYNKQDVGLQFLGVQECGESPLIWDDYAPTRRQLRRHFSISKAEPLEKMAVGTIPKGKKVGVQGHKANAEEDSTESGISPGFTVDGHHIYDYSHHLSPEHQEAGLTLHVLDGQADGKHLLNARLMHDGKIHGEVEGDIHNNDFGIRYSNVKPEFRHRGLGQKMYEVLYAHGLHNHGVKTVSGDEHSTLSSAVHRRLAEAHGFKYKPRVNPNASTDIPPEANEPGEFDEAYKPYKYTIKAEMPPNGLDALFARTKALSQHMRQLADRGPQNLVFPHPRGGTVVVSHDPSKPGRWRATRIEADGVPSGHIEAEDHHGAIKHAHSYGADAMNPIDLDVKKFETDLGSWLAKATRPENYKAIVRAISDEGRRHVDHTNQLNAHPSSLHPEVEHYHNEVLNSSKIHKPKAGKREEGITRKLIYHTEHQPSELSIPSPHGHQRSFMVKPYHEGVIGRTAGWQKFPIQGWAEMTNQAMFHAGGIGHLHQKVHVAEHDMGPGHEKEPALVVHMEKGLSPIGDLGNLHLEHGTPVSQDAAKIVAMDFLTSNLDRHAGNLMVEPKTLPYPKSGEKMPDWVTDAYSDVHGVNRVMAIDHSRNFQYLNNHAYKWDKPSFVKKKQLTDKLRNYFFGTAASRPATARLFDRPDTHNEKMDFMQKVGEPMAEWWGQVGENVKKAFNTHLEHIKDPEVKAHLKRNFEARAKHLDDLAHFGVDNHGLDWYDSEVSLYQPGEKTDHELEDEKYHKSKENP